MATPLVTVSMPVYDADTYVREAVDSILAQTLGDSSCSSSSTAPPMGPTTAPPTGPGTSCAATSGGHARGHPARARTGAGAEHLRVSEALAMISFLRRALFPRQTSHSRIRCADRRSSDSSPARRDPRGCPSHRPCWGRESQWSVFDARRTAHV